MSQSEDMMSIIDPEALAQAKKRMDDLIQEVIGSDLRQWKLRRIAETLKTLQVQRTSYFHKSIEHERNPAFSRRPSFNPALNEADEKLWAELDRRDKLHPPEKPKMRPKRKGRTSVDEAVEAARKSAGRHFRSLK